MSRLFPYGLATLLNGGAESEHKYQSIHLKNMLDLSGLISFIHLTF